MDRAVFVHYMCGCVERMCRTYMLCVVAALFGMHFLLIKAIGSFPFYVLSSQFLIFSLAEVSFEQLKTNPSVLDIDTCDVETGLYSYNNTIWWRI